MKKSPKRNWVNVRSDTISAYRVLCVQSKFPLRKGWDESSCLSCIYLEFGTKHLLSFDDARYSSLALSRNVITYAIDRRLQVKWTNERISRNHALRRFRCTFFLVTLDARITWRPWLVASPILTTAIKQSYPRSSVVRVKTRIIFNQNTLRL